MCPKRLSQFLGALRTIGQKISHPQLRSHVEHGGVAVPVDKILHRSADCVPLGATPLED